MQRDAAAIFLVAFVANLAFADCQSLKPLAPAEVATARPDLLFKNMLAACKSGIPEKFFALQSKRSNDLISKLPGKDKGRLFAEYCAFAAEANKKLEGRLDTGIHSFKQDKYATTECGQRISYWYIHSKDGVLALRLEVTLENSQLKIDTH